MEKIVHAIQDDYPDEFAHCYGCGRLNRDGLHVRTGWEGDKTVSYYSPREEQIGFPGFVYGGLIASVVDCHSMGAAALTVHRKNGFEPGSEEDPPRFVTGSLHVDYLKPTPHGVELKFVSEVKEIHPKRYLVKVEMLAEGEVCATAEVNAVVMPETFMK